MARIREKTLKFPGLNNTYTFADEADLFDANVDCAVGEYRIYNGDMYCCTTAHTGAWDASHFKAVKMGKEVSELKTDFIQLDETVVGEKNYIKNKKLVTAPGATKGNVTDDNNYSVSEKIPMSSMPASGTSIIVFYGTISENSMFALYNSQDEFLDSWSLQSSGTSREFTFNYTSYQDLTYVRFFFQKEYEAKITNHAGDVIYWSAQNSGGLVDDVNTLELIVNNLPSTFMQTNSYIDFSMVNRLDPSACEVNTIVTPSTGSVDAYSGYFTTDFIEIHSGETLYFFRNDNNGYKTCRMFAAYDADKNVISNLGSTEEVGSITQDGDMAFVKCSFAYLDTDYARTPLGTNIYANQAPEYFPRFGNSPCFKSDFIRKNIYIRATDTEAQVIQKLINAYNQANCDVYFEQGEYTFGTELAKVSTDYGMLYNEIPIGNNCRYYFNGSVLTATLNLSSLTPAEGDDEFYCNFFGCQRKPNSFEMHDGVLIATDTRYVVHDEANRLGGDYHHLYQNMEMQYITSQRQETIRKCIGGGTGKNGVVEIVGCKFTTDATDTCVSFHGNGTDVAGAKFDLNIRDSWFSNGIRAGELSTSQTARLFYAGNSAASAPTTYDRWTVTAFLNEVRT